MILLGLIEKLLVSNKPCEIFYFNRKFFDELSISQPTFSHMVKRGEMDARAHPITVK